MTGLTEGEAGARGPAGAPAGAAAGAFGALLRGHRRGAGLTQEALAARAGLSRRGLQHLEAGDARPWPATLEALAAALALGPEDRARLRAAARAAGPRAPRSPGERRGPRRPGTGPTGPSNLPLQLTSFVGRERELATTRGLVAAHRLVTLTGAGGVGKTRLALQAAAEALDGYEGGVWLVELGALADPALVPAALAAAVGVREEPGRPLPATLADALRPKRLLLVLDNCEHLLDACARLADALLRACPRVSLLATSREPLGIAGEAAWRVPSLELPPLPDPLRPPSVESLTQVGAVRLFVERAVAVQPPFRLTAADAPAVAQICRRLDGIPLALELAAARVRVLPPAQLLGRLEDRFRLLTGGSRTALERHRTLRAAVDWSHALLTGPERRLFARLSVFAGGWTLEAAEAVCAEDGLEADAVLDLLTRLVDQSLVLAEPQPDGTARFRLLETLRQYAREKLDAAGAADAVRGRHAAVHGALADLPREAAGEGGWYSGEQPAWLERLDREHDNLRAALAWWLDTGQGEPALRLADALYIYWAARGRYAEGRRWLEAALAAGGEAPPALRARALNRAGSLAQWQGDYARARAHHEASVAHWHALGDAIGAADAQESLAVDLWQAGDAERAAAMMAANLAVFRDHGLPAAISRSLRNLGLVARSRGQYDRAAALFAESVEHARAAGHLVFVARGLGHLGRVASLQGDPHRAAACLAEALAIAEQAGSTAGTGTHAVADFVEWLAAVAGARGQPARAARLFGAAAAVRDTMGTPRYAPERAGYDRDVEATRGALGEAAFAVAWQEGRAMTLEQAIAYALAEEAPEPAVVAPNAAAPAPASLPPRVPAGGPAGAAPPDALRPPTAPPGAGGAAAAPGGLTPREREVAQLVARGLTNRQIAAALVIAPTTAARHVEHILAKLGLRSRTQVAVWAVAHGVADGAGGADGAPPG